MDINSSKSFQMRKNIRSFSRRSQRMATLPVFSQQKQQRLSTLSFSNTIYKSVKKAELKLITGQKWQKLPTEPIQQQKSSYFKLAHDQLNTVRQQFDIITFQRKRQDLKISKLKVKFVAIEMEISKFKSIKQKYEKAKIKCLQIANKMLPEQLERELANQKMELQVCTHMMKTLQIDVLYYQQKQYVLDKDLENIKLQLRALKSIYYSKHQQKDVSNKLALQLRQQIFQDQILRQNHLGTYQQQVMNKTGAFFHGSFRITQMSKIVADVQQDKTKIQKQWKNIYLTHIFLSKMLTNKINRQMRTFNVVEQSYLTIKNMTHVEDINQFVKRFLKKQQVYGQLLGKISQSEQRIAQLKLEQQLLRRQFEQLSNPAFQMTKLLNSAQKSYREMPNKNQQYLTQQIRIKKFESKLPTWLDFNIRKLIKSTTKQQSMQIDMLKNYKNYQLSQIAEKFKKYLTILKETMDQCELLTLDPLVQLQLETAPINYQLKDNDKNQLMVQSYQLKSNKQSTNRQAQQQWDILMLQRQETIRKNDKFMKELRKQKLQNRRLKMQKAVKKVDG